MIFSKNFKYWFLLILCLIVLFLIYGFEFSIISNYIFLFSNYLFSIYDYLYSIFNRVDSTGKASVLFLFMIIVYEILTEITGDDSLAKITRISKKEFRKLIQKIFFKKK